MPSVHRNTQKASCRDNILFRHVLREILQGGQRLLAVLDLIQNDECLPGDDGASSICVYVPIFQIISYYSFVKYAFSMMDRMNMKMTISMDKGVPWVRTAHTGMRGGDAHPHLLLRQDRLNLIFPGTICRRRSKGLAISVHQHDRQLWNGYQSRIHCGA
jgi:hypothetical protein